MAAMEVQAGVGNLLRDHLKGILPGKQPFSLLEVQGIRANSADLATRGPQLKSCRNARFPELGSAGESLGEGSEARSIWL